MKVFLVCVVMVAQMAGFVCDLHSESSHVDESSGVHLNYAPESHHSDSHDEDCVTQPQVVALLSIWSGMKADLVLQMDAFIVSPAYFSIEAHYTVPPSNWLPDSFVSSPLRFVSPILRV